MNDLVFFHHFEMCHVIDGMKNIIQQLGTNEFERVRVGVGEKPSKMDLADWVLSRFKPEEREDLDNAIDNAVKAVERQHGRNSKH